MDPSRKVFNGYDGIGTRYKGQCIAPSLTDTNLAKVLLSDEGKRVANAEGHLLNHFGSLAGIAAAAKF